MSMIIASNETWHIETYTINRTLIHILINTIYTASQEQSTNRISPSQHIQKFIQRPTIQYKHTTNIDRIINNFIPKYMQTILFLVSNNIVQVYLG